MSDVLFITPNIHGSVLDESVGTLLLATILQNSGISVEIMQFLQFGDIGDFDAFLNTALKKIKEKTPRIVSFYSRCDTYHIALTLAKELKACDPDLWIVFGGPQADITAEETIKELPWVDFVCRGEGETTIVPFFTSLLNGSPDLSIPGLAYRGEDGVMLNPKPQLLQDLDSLPEVNYALLQHSDTVSGYFPVDVGRGCPFGCTYCSTKTFWGRKYRLKSPERIVREICRAHEEFGATAFAFEHDMFTMKRDQVLRTCELMTQLDFPVTWKCSARMDCIDREMIDTMAASGLDSIFVGIETGSARMQKLINKNLKLGGVLDMLEYISSKGVKVTASFIYGFPEETLEDIEQTLQMIAEISKIPGIVVQTHLCTFLPGTELSARYMQDMTRAESFSDIVGTNALEECRGLIEAHPVLFNHFMEYKTPMRAKLEHFATFVKMWYYMHPVYAHIAARYEQLMQMYCDFVEANRDVLELHKKEGMEQRVMALLRQDLFMRRFSDDEYYPMISDIYRFRITHTESLAVGESETDVYCFSPIELKNCSSLSDLSRGVYMVTRTKNQNGSIRVQVQGKKR